MSEFDEVLSVHTSGCVSSLCKGLSVIWGNFS